MNPATHSEIPRHDYLGALGPDNRIIKEAVRLGAERAVARGLRHVTMAIPTLGHLDGMIEALFGEDFTRLARRDYQVNLDGFVVHIATRQRAPRHVGPIVAVFTQPDQTRSLAANRHTTDFVFVPWTEDDVVEFQSFAPSAERFPCAPMLSETLPLQVIPHFRAALTGERNAKAVADSRTRITLDDRSGGATYARPQTIQRLGEEAHRSSC